MGKKIILIISIYLISFLNTVRAENTTQPQEKFLNLLLKYGYKVYSKVNYPNYYEIYTTQNISFILYQPSDFKDLSLSNKNKINIISEESYLNSVPEFIYYENYKDSYNNTTYYIDYGLIDRNFSNLEKFLLKFTVFDSSLNANLYRIYQKCVTYRIDCSIFLDLYSLNFNSRKNLNLVYDILSINLNNRSNYFDKFYFETSYFQKDYYFYTEIMVLMLVFFIFYFFKYIIILRKKNQTISKINLKKFYLITILISLYIFLRLLIGKIDFNFISFYFANLVFLLFSLYFKLSEFKINKYVKFYLLFTFILIPLLIFLKNSCNEMNPLKEYALKSIRFTFKKQDFCPNYPFFYPENFNDKVPIVLNDLLIYHPQFKVIKNLGIENFNIDSINEDSYVFSLNESKVINYILNKFSESKKTYSSNSKGYNNSILTSEKNVIFNINCNEDVDNQSLIINEYYKLNPSNYFHRTSNDSILNCKKGSSKQITLNLALDTVKLINIQDSSKFSIDVIPQKYDLPLNLYLFSNSIFFKSTNGLKSNRVLFYNFVPGTEYGVNWNEIDLNNKNNIKLFLEKISNEIIHNTKSKIIEISTLQRNSLFYNFGEVF